MLSNTLRAKLKLSRQLTERPRSKFETFIEPAVARDVLSDAYTSHASSRKQYIFENDLNVKSINSGVRRTLLCGDSLIKRIRA